MGIDKTMLGNATGLAAGAAAFLGQSAKFVQLHPESVKAIQKGQLIPGTDGFFRMMTRGADKKFVQQLQWKKTSVNPAKLMSLQMVAVQLALKTAIAEVEESVQRVEGKVEEVLRLAHANDRATCSATASPSTAWSRIWIGTDRSPTPIGIRSLASVLPSIAPSSSFVITPTAPCGPSIRRDRYKIGPVSS